MRYIFLGFGLISTFTFCTLVHFGFASKREDRIYAITLFIFSFIFFCIAIAFGLIYKSFN